MGNTKNARSFGQHGISGRLFAALMAITLVVGLMPTFALADDDYPDTDDPVLAWPDDGTPVVDVGNVTVDAQDAGGHPVVCAISDDVGDATVNVHGDVTVTGDDSYGSSAVEAESRGSTATVNVDGDVSADVNSLSAGDQTEVDGVKAFAFESGAEDAVVHVSGNVEAVIDSSGEDHLVACGVYQMANSEDPGRQASSYVAVDGDVNVEANGKSGEATGIDSYADYYATITTIVEGGLTVKGRTATGVSVEHNSLSINPVDADTQTTVTIGKGGITAIGEVDSLGVFTDNNGGDITVLVDGDVTATTADEDRYASGIQISGDTGTTDILVTGTVAARSAGFINASNDTKYDITVWKVESDTVAAKFFFGDDPIVEDKSTEEAINYIIRLEQPKEGNILGLIGTRVKEFAFGDGTLSFDVANMGQKVYLDVEDGWVITAAFNGMGQRVPLDRDENGWYVVVPNGGGVYLSAQVAKEQPEPPAPNGVVTVSGAGMPAQPCASNYECTPNTGDSCPSPLAIALVALGSLAVTLFAARKQKLSA